MNTRVVAAAVPVEIVEAIERIDTEPGGKSRFIRAALVQAVRKRERDRKRAGRRHAHLHQEPEEPQAA
jgi:hypothetical protein